MLKRVLDHAEVLVNLQGRGKLVVGTIGGARVLASIAGLHELEEKDAS